MCTAVAIFCAFLITKKCAIVLRKVNRGIRIMYRLEKVFIGKSTRTDENPWSLIV